MTYRGFDFQIKSPRREFLSFLFFSALILLTAPSDVGIFIFILLLIPFQSLQIRRLRDAGMSCWLILLQLLPVADLFYYLFLLSPSAGNNNKTPSEQDVIERL
ncbi:MAG: DUF805 domain-containing protein [Alphaproteobacteria bacterium]|nr:DUF805 domain-containing protein [Alphaproteobacteria bacterium]